jgi:hypothetical protein
MAQFIGTFDCIEALHEACPVGDVGDYAIMTTTGSLWHYKGSGWVDSGTPGIVVSTNGVPSTIVYVDGNRTDTYDPDGTVERPFKTLSSAMSAIDFPAALHIAPGNYTETGDVIFPDVPLVVYGNNSSISFSGNVTIPNPYYVRYNLFTTIATGKVLTFNTFTAGARCMVFGGGITGNVAINSYVEMTQCQLNGGTITVGDTGQLLVMLCTPTSKFVSTGVIIFDKVNMNTGSADYLVKSTKGLLWLSNSLIINTTHATLAISCDNAAPITAPNMFVNCNCGTTGLITANTAYALWSKNVAVPNGTHFVGVPDILSASTVVEAGTTGSIFYKNALGVLTALPIGTTGQTLKVVAGLPAWAS